MRFHNFPSQLKESSTQEELHAPTRTLPTFSIVVMVTAFLVMPLASCGDPTPEPTPEPSAEPTMSDREALVKLYISTNGSMWEYSTNWLSDTPIDEWPGVTTDNAGRVTELVLSGNQLSGDIPPEVASLSNLKVLDLSRNRLSGEIPPELSNLSKLKVLDLSWNKLRGGIPRSLGKLAKLEVLNLRRNGLYGWVPPDLGNLSNLTKLGLGWNALLGHFPPELRNLQSLTYLDVGGTSLNGCLPNSWQGRFEVRLSKYPLVGDQSSDLGGLPFCVETSEPELSASRKALIALYRGTDGQQWNNNLNWLTGHPIGIWYGVKVDSSGRVIELRLPDNDLSGAIPSELGNLTSLQVLDLHGNDLSGELPPELGNLTKLVSLNLSVNRLNGELQPELGNLTNLTEIHLQVNELNGRIPRSLGGLSNLSTLSLWNNRLSGTIPPELGNLTGLLLLDLHGNSLSGEVPPQMGALTNLQRLGLDGNDLVGCLPNTLRGQLNMTESTLGWLPFCGSDSVPQESVATGTDRDALVVLYEAAGGQNWKNKMHWLSVRPIREWHGVEVNGKRPCYSTKTQLQWIER